MARNRAFWTCCFPKDRLTKGCHTGLLAGLEKPGHWPGFLCPHQSSFRALFIRWQLARIVLPDLVMRGPAVAPASEVARIGRAGLCMIGTLPDGLCLTTRQCSCFRRYAPRRFVRSAMIGRRMVSSGEGAQPQLHRHGCLLVAPVNSPVFRSPRFLALLCCSAGQRHRLAVSLPSAGGH